MAFAPHTLIALGGHLAGAEQNSEIWQCGVRVSVFTGEPGAPTGPVSDPQAYLDAIAAGVGTWWASAGMTNTATLAWLKCNNINAAGKYADPTTTHRHDYDPEIGGGTASHTPNFLTLAVSFRTAKKRGPGSHGRVYLPTAIPDEGGLSLVSDSAAATAASHGVGLLNAISKTVGSDTVFPVVASRVNATLTAISHVQVSTVIDVQRRRKNALVGTYSGFPYPAS